MLRLVYKEWERGEFAASLSLFDDNLTLTIDSGIPDGGDYIGPDGVRAYMSVFLAPWESLTIAAESFRYAGGQRSGRGQADWDRAQQRRLRRT